MFSNTYFLKHFNRILVLFESELKQAINQFLLGWINPSLVPQYVNWSCKKKAKTVGMSTHFVQNLNCRFPEIYGLIFVGIPQIALFPASTISDRRPKKVFQHCNWFCNSYIFITHWYKTYAWTSCTQISIFMQGPNLYRLFLQHFSPNWRKICPQIFNTWKTLCTKFANMCF